MTSHLCVVPDLTSDLENQNLAETCRCSHLSVQIKQCQQQRFLSWCSQMRRGNPVRRRVSWQLVGKEMHLKLLMWLHTKAVNSNDFYCGLIGVKLGTKYNILHQRVFAQWLITLRLLTLLSFHLQMLAALAFRLTSAVSHCKSCIRCFVLVHDLTFRDHPLDAQLHVTEFNELSDKIILVPGGRSGRTGPGEEIQRRLEQGHFLRSPAAGSQRAGSGRGLFGSKQESSAAGRSVIKLWNQLILFFHWKQTFSSCR